MLHLAIEDFTCVFAAIDDVDVAAERWAADGPCGAEERIVEAKVDELDGGPVTVGRQLRGLQCLNRILAEICDNGPGGPIEIDLAE